MHLTWLRFMPVWPVRGEGGGGSNLPPIPPPFKGTPSTNPLKPLQATPNPNGQKEGRWHSRDQ